MPDEQGTKLATARELLREFRMERILYMTVTFAVLVLQIVFFCLFYAKDQVGWGEFIAFIAPGSGLLLTGNGVLRMWTDVTKYVFSRSEP